MINWVVSSFQRLPASGLVAAFVLSLLLSICFLLVLLVFCYWCIFCLFSLQPFCVFCLVAAVVFFASISLLMHLFWCFHSVLVVFLTSAWPFPVLFCSLLITIIILYSIHILFLAEVQLHPLFSVMKVWFDSFWLLREKLIKKSSASQPGLLYKMTRHVSSFFFFFFFLTSYHLTWWFLYLISIFALVLQFCSTFILSPCFYFCYCSFSSMLIFSSFVSLLFSFWGESYFYLLLCRVFHLFIYFFILLKKFGAGWGICEADVWVQHGSVWRVMGSKTLNTSVRLMLLTVPGWVGQCARLANDYQAQLSPAGTKS